MSLVLGTIADYIAETGTASNPQGYTTNPPAAYGGPSGSRGIVYQPSTENENGYIRGQWNEFTPDTCGCGQQCAAWIHESLTDWWFPFFFADCAGEPCFNIPQSNCAVGPTDAGYLKGDFLNRQCANPQDNCDPCNDPYKTSFFDMAAFTADQDFGAGGITLANLFPGAWLQAFEFDPLARAKLDFLAVSCGAQIINLQIEFELPLGRRPFQLPGCPPGSIFNRLTKRCEAPSLTGKQAIGFVDPPLPRFRPAFLPREITAIAKSYDLPLAGAATRPPAPAGAFDSPAFAVPNSGIPLPIHPVLSRLAIESVCGVCGDHDAQESEEAEL